jgi:molybdopterin/thiamine biosynthesis adenylyltransferase/rhodanese-related sulfurtransferase
VSDTPIQSLTATDLERYSRHLSLREIGVAGQEKLKGARVLVIGAGGLGSPSALYLAASGIGTLGVIDNDRVDLSNLQRQVLYDTDAVARPKTEAARERLLALNPDLDVIAHQTELRASNARDLFSRYDIVLDGTDRFATRYLANDACVLLKKPLVSAAIHRFEGQAMTYVPDRGPCYRCLFPEPPTDGLVPNCAEAGVLGVLPGVMGTIQATEAIKLIAGIGEPLIGRLLTYDALAMRFAEFRFARRADCAVCGGEPSIVGLVDAPELCSAADRASVARWSPRELHERLKDVAIIDVREPREFAVSHLADAINAPIGTMVQRVAELPRERTLVFVCRSGARSLTASGIAIRAGNKEIAHLEGGLLAWAREIDPAFEVAPAG